MIYITLFKQNITNDPIEMVNTRDLGYIIGPLIGGLLILWMTPTTVISITGFISAIALIPTFFLSTKAHIQPKKLNIKFHLMFSLIPVAQSRSHKHLVRPPSRR